MYNENSLNTFPNLYGVGVNQGLLSGCIHKYNIVVKDGNVIITGGSISGWTPGNEEEDIVINGEEINPQTNNML